MTERRDTRPALGGVTGALGRLETRRQFIRRGLVRGSALGGLSLAAVVAACSKAGPRTPAPAAVEPKRGGILVRASGGAGGWDTRGTALDPHVIAPVSSQGQRLFYQGLLGYNLRTREVEPEIGQKWEQPSPTEYLFALQPGIKWHNRPPANGRELRVEDVVFSLNRARTPEPLYQHRSLLEAVDKIEAVDRATLRITTKEPSAGLLTNLAGDGLLVLAPEVVERAGRFAPVPENAVGTGAFIVKSIEENVAAEYIRNPDYWKPSRPYLEGFRSLHVVDDQAGYAALLAGQAHVTTLPGSEVKRYIARQGPGYTPDWYKDMAIYLATPNLTRKPMDDARVTRALRLFLDHEEMKTAWAEVQFGRGRHGSVLPPGLEDWDLPEEEYARRIFWRQPKDEAIREGLELLRAAGFTRDNPLRLDELPTSTTPFLRAGAELMHAQWRQHSQGLVEIGGIRAYDMAQFLQIQAQGTFTYGLWGFLIGTDDVGDWMTTLYHSRGARNRMRLNDPFVDTMLNRQRSLFDTQQRRAVIRELVSYLADKSPGVSLSGRLSLNGVHSQVRGFAPESFINGRQYEWVWFDT